MRDRERVLREIAVNAAVVFTCRVEDCALVLAALESEQGVGFRCSVRAGDRVEEGHGATESEAAWALLDRMIDRANGQSRPAESLVMTPELEKALRLLQLSRLRLIEEIRRELEDHPATEDVKR